MMDARTLITTTDAIFAGFTWLDDLVDCGSIEDEQRRLFKMLLLCLLRHRDMIQTTAEAMLRLQERTLS